MAEPKPQPALEPGFLLAGRYRIESFLAEGGMGQVYEALDLELQDRVAVKIIRPELLRDPIAVARFRREIRMASSIEHPNVCRTLNHGEADGRLFLAMELLRGETLSQRLKRKGPCSEEQTLQLLRPLSEALDAAHGKGVIHRDLKAANIFITQPEGRPPRVVITDFGLACAATPGTASLPSLTMTGALLGTPAYMAPEQVEDRPISPATDVYALGIVLYEMLTGRFPFEGESPLSMAVQRLTQEPADPREFLPRLDEAWAKALLRCLAREPAARYQRAGELLDALTREPASALEQRRAPPAPGKGLTPSALPALARFALVAGLVLGLGLLAFWRKEAHELGVGAWVVGNLQSQRLTSTPQRELAGSLAPDGRAFVSTLYNPQEAQYDLYWQSLEGGAPRQLTHTPQDEWVARWTPDGSAIAFTRAGRTLEAWRMDLRTLNETKLADGAWPAWSPDETEVAFVRAAGGETSAILRKNLESGRETEVCRTAGDAETLDWSPDGRLLAWVSEQAAHVVSSSGGTPRRLQGASPIGSLAWAPSSAAIYCNLSRQGQRNIWRIPLDGTQPRALTASGEGWGLHFPAISSDGSRLLYTHEQKQNHLLSFQEGGSPSMLPLQTTFVCFDVDPQGRRLAFLDLQPGPGETELGLFELETRQERSLGSGSCPAFDPGGSRLAFARLDPGQEGLWILDLETGREFEAGHLGRLVLTPEERRPEWAPDGKSIVIPTAGEADEAGLTLVELEGGAQRLLARGRFGYPAWSPDGRLIAASGIGEQGGGLYVFDAKTGGGGRISKAGSYKAAPLWAEDGRSLRLLVKEATAPELRSFRLDGMEIGQPWLLPISIEPGFWGVFDIRRTPGRGWLLLQERYEGDLYLLTPADAPSAQR